MRARRATRLLFDGAGLTEISGHELDTIDAGMVAALSGMEPEDVPEDAAPVLDESARARCRASLMGCVMATMPDYKENWHHTVLADALDKVRTRKIKRLLVLMPPRHGKTQLVSRHFPAYLLGKNPNEQVIGCSYSAELAGSVNRDVQRIMTTPEYQDAFPNVRLNEHNVVSTARGELRNSRIFEVVGYKGYYISAGINGPITGKGFTIGIVDDPIKNRQEAESKTFRDKTWDWWTSTFLPRGEGALSPYGDDAIIVTLTHWHHDDLAGRIMKHAKETGEEWTIIRFPAVLDEEPAANDPRSMGAALWPRKYDEEALKAKKLAVGSRDWNALYQGRPSVKGGNLFKKAYWRYFYPEALKRRFQQVVVSVDAAFKDLETSSYVVIQVWGIIDHERYLVHQVRGHLSFLASCKALLQVHAEFPVANLYLIEDKANGPAIINALQKLIPGLVARNPKGSKPSRAQSVIAQVEAGHVHLPYGAPWVDDFVEELGAFPHGTNDDQVDALVQLLLEFEEDPLSFLEALTS